LCRSLRRKKAIPSSGRERLFAVKAVRPFGNSIGETPAALTKGARFFFAGACTPVIKFKRVDYEPAESVFIEGLFWQRLAAFCELLYGFCLQVKTIFALTLNYNH